MVLIMVIIMEHNRVIYIAMCFMCPSKCIKETRHIKVFTIFEQFEQSQNKAAQNADISHFSGKSFYLYITFRKVFSICEIKTSKENGAFNKLKYYTFLLFL